MGKRKKGSMVDEELMCESDGGSSKKEKKKTSYPSIGFKLRDVSAKNETQKEVFRQFGEGKDLFLYGSAGSGKSFLAMYCALSELEQGNVHKIYIVRSTVQGRDMGFLPGNIQEKMEVFKQPYQGICAELLERGDAYSILEKKGFIDFQSTSFLRGLTFRDSVVVIDEVQNMVWSEILSILTRIGENTRVIIAGDGFQNDLINQNKRNQESCMDNLIKICQRMKCFSSIQFQIKDIVRGPFVKDFLLACYDLKLM